MLVKLSSQDYSIIDHGTVLLFNEKSDLTINITVNSYNDICLTVRFLESVLEEQKINTIVTNNKIVLECINFFAEGTGNVEPAEIAVVDGKRIYFIFWAYLQGQIPGKTKVRKVDYTIFQEK